MIAAAMTAGEVRQTLPHVPASARSTLLHAYKVGFASSMDHLMVIGAIVAFIGMVGAFALVHQRDFVDDAGGSRPERARHPARNGALGTTVNHEHALDLQSVEFGRDLVHRPDAKDHPAR